MARIPNGILGEFIGTAGNVSGYMRMGTNFIRSRRRPSSKPPSPARLAQQQKIRVCNEFTRLFSGRGFFDKTFPARVKTATGYNKATSALMRLAVSGSYPDIRLNWNAVRISEGGMPPAINAGAATTGAAIAFSWSDNSGDGTARASDRVVTVAYFPEQQQLIFDLNAGYRSDCLAVLDTKAVLGHAHTWIGFVSGDGGDAADSVYTGVVVV